MPECVVKWCRSRAGINCPGITFHYFPADPIRKNKWIAAVQLERHENGWKPSKTSRVCSVHFNEKDFYKSLKGYTMLHKTAVPVCTMIRPKETSISRDITEDEKMNKNERLQSTNENFEMRDLPESQNKTNIADLQGHKRKAQKLTMENNINTEWNDGVNEEPRKNIIINNIVSTEVHRFETRGSCVTPINIPLTNIEAGLETPRTESKLEQKLRKKTILAEKRLSKIRNLKRRNKRLIMKNISLKNTLSQINLVILQKILESSAPL